METNRLQQLLDERWPLNISLSYTEKIDRIGKRSLFTEGYNARIAEEKEVRKLQKETLEILKRDYNPGYDHSDFHTI